MFLFSWPTAEENINASCRPKYFVCRLIYFGWNPRLAFCFQCRCFALTETETDFVVISVTWCSDMFVNCKTNSAFLGMLFMAVLFCQLFFNLFSIFFSVRFCFYTFVKCSTCLGRLFFWKQFLYLFISFVLLLSVN